MELPTVTDTLERLEGLIRDADVPLHRRMLAPFAEQVVQRIGHREHAQQSGTDHHVQDDRDGKGGSAARRLRPHASASTVLRTVL